jgi:hypothetical protein
MHASAAAICTDNTFTTTTNNNSGLTTAFLCARRSFSEVHRRGHGLKTGDGQ